MNAVAPPLDADFIAAFRSGKLTAAQAEQFLNQDRAAVLFQFLELSAAVASTASPASGPHAPPSTIPLYDKPQAKTKTKPAKKRGGQLGHAGASRRIPEITDTQQHELPACPCCGGELVRTKRTRRRIIEDIPENLKPEVVEHVIHRDWCPNCKKQVEPKVPDALPGCTIGHRTMIFSAWLHYGLGLTTSRIVSVFNAHLRLPLTDGGLTDMWHRLADIVMPWYEQIRELCLKSGVLFADETGWRVLGDTWWLWCFTCTEATYYMIDESRGHAALDEFFVDEFGGILVSDFWSVYDTVGRLRQKCWPHLLRDLKEVDKKERHGSDWSEFAKKLRRIYADAIRLESRHATMPADEYGMKLARLHGRIIDLSIADWDDVDAKRLAKRLHKYGEELLTFVEFENVPPDNNTAERVIRPAVEMRKLSYGNQSERGVRTRNVLMSVFRTLKQRGFDPNQVLEQALRTYTLTGKIPDLDSLGKAAD